MKRIICGIISVCMILGFFNIVPNDISSVSAAVTPSVSYMTHVQGIGDTLWVNDGESSGTVGQSKRLEGIKIKLADGVDGGITYTTHVQTYGWNQGWISDGGLAGTEGESKRLEGIKIQLTGNIANSYDVYYRVHAQNYGWQGWVKNGEFSGTSGMSKRLEAIQIKIVPKGGSPLSANTSSVDYSTHVQNFGWQAPSADGNLGGTVGLSKRLEAIKINLNSTEYTGGISYKTHVQSIGWEPSWRYDGELSGTEGRGLRLEAIAIELYGEIANYYDVYYQVQIQTEGWLGWTSNGSYAGSQGGSKRMEGIHILLVKKGMTPPTSNVSDAFVTYVSASSSNIDQVIAYTNVARKDNGKPSLIKDAILCNMANKRAQEIAQKFSHTRPDGTDCFTIFDEFGYRCYAYGENIAAGYRTPSAVVQGWMDSPGHRANILYSSFSRIGVGYYEKDGRKYWVQLFAG